MKRCTSCGREFALDQFYRGPSGNPVSPCRECKRLWQKRHRAENPERVRVQRRASYRARYEAVTRPYKLRKLYGLTELQYLDLLARQGGGCAICAVTPEELSRTATGEPKWLAVDHDHACCPGSRSCGKCVRGLLCSNCNKGLGNFQDDPQLLVIARHYLELSGPPVTIAELSPTQLEDIMQGNTP